MGRNRRWEIINGRKKERKDLTVKEEPGEKTSDRYLGIRG